MNLFSKLKYPLKYSILETSCPAEGRVDSGWDVEADSAIHDSWPVLLGLTDERDVVLSFEKRFMWTGFEDRNQ